MTTIKATWRRIAKSRDIRRSSQVICLADDYLSLFGGEIMPRIPVDNKLYRIPIDAENPFASNAEVIESQTAPSPRVGSASTTLNGKTYLFSGRGGESMLPIEQNGALHVLDNQTAEWKLLTPAEPSKPFPQARSYHAMTSDNETIYVHAGCPEKGRLSDLWAFNITSRLWIKLPDAPGPDRGGASIAHLRNKVYRMNGFDGNHEQGCALDVYDVHFNEWTTMKWKPENGPSPRSVSTLSAVKIDGRDHLVTMFGEGDPSNLGHQGAGRMLDDVWAYDVAQDSWTKVEVEGEKPQARGWFASEVLPGKNEIILQGGLAEDNNRIGDVWVLSF